MVAVPLVPLLAQGYRCAHGGDRPHCVWPNGIGKDGAPVGRVPPARPGRLGSGALAGADRPRRGGGAAAIARRVVERLESTSRALVPASHRAARLRSRAHPPTRSCWPSPVPGRTTAHRRGTNRAATSARRSELLRLDYGFGWLC